MRLHQKTLRDRKRARRGFTLVELLAVLAMISILSVLAIAGYRRYLSSSKSSEAKALMGSIRIAQENHRAETLSYLSCSGNLTNWYPASPNGKKRHWLNNGHAEFACWRMLNVVTDTYTRYGFTVMAGGPGGVMAGMGANPLSPTPMSRSIGGGAPISSY